MFCVCCEPTVFPTLLRLQVNHLFFFFESWRSEAKMYHLWSGGSADCPQLPSFAWRSWGPDLQEAGGWPRRPSPILPMPITHLLPASHQMLPVPPGQCVQKLYSAEHLECPSPWFAPDQSPTKKVFMQCGTLHCFLRNRHSFQSFIFLAKPKIHTKCLNCWQRCHTPTHPLWPRKQNCATWCPHMIDHRPLVLPLFCPAFPRIILCTAYLKGPNSPAPVSYLPCHFSIRQRCNFIGVLFKLLLLLSSLLLLFLLILLLLLSLLLLLLLLQWQIHLENTFKERSSRLLTTIETFDQSDEKTWPDQQKNNDKENDKYIERTLPKALWQRGVLQCFKT